MKGEGASEARGELQLAVFAGDDVAAHALPPSGSVSIGRAEENDVRIDHPSVSRKHAILHVGPPLRVEDLGSANGTFVRDPRDPSGSGDTQDMRQLSGQTHDVVVGDCINVGSVMVVVRRVHRAPALTVDPDASPASSNGGIVLRDSAMRALYEQAFRAAQAPISVILLGETGVGKEVVARAIHERSPRARKPFMALNCGALGGDLIENELFGHVKGAYTGAPGSVGLLEAADGGTVFLDEVADLPMATQVKLLRVLEDRKVLRLGGRVPVAVDVRFIAATNKDLEGAAADGSFRQDLFFRLNGIVFTIPPLRQRISEVEPLARGFVANACRQMDRRDVPELSPEALTLLQRHPWQGNVRELRQVIDRAVLLCTGRAILPEHLPSKMSSPSRQMPRVTPVPPNPATERAPGVGVDAAPANDEMVRLKQEMSELERKRILDALEKCAGNQTQAAELLGISRRTLVTRLGEFGIPRPRKH